MTDWPADTDTVKTWFHQQIADGVGFFPRVFDADRSRVDVELDDADIVTLAIDLTGVTADFPLAKEDEPQDVTTDDDVPTGEESRRPATVRAAELRAHPVTISGARLSVDAEIRDAPIDWVVAEDGSRDIVSREAASGPRMSGTITASMPHDDVFELVRSFIKARFRPRAMAVKRTRATYTQQAPDTFVVRFAVKFRFNMLTRPIWRGKAVVRISPDGVATLVDLRFHSWHLALSVALLTIRRDVRNLRGRSGNLSELFGPGVRLDDVRVDVTDELHISGRFV